MHMHVSLINVIRRHYASLVPRAAGQFCDPLDIRSSELVEDFLIFPENHTERSVNCEKNSERTSFTWIVPTLCNLEDSCHSTYPTWSDIPPWKVLPPKKDLLGTHLVADFPPDTIVEPIIRISVARIGGQVQLVHLGKGQTIVLADLAHRYVCYMSLRSG